MAIGRINGSSHKVVKDKVKATYSIRDYATSSASLSVDDANNQKIKFASFSGMNDNSGMIKFSGTRTITLNYGNQFFSKSYDLETLYPDDVFTSVHAECYRNYDTKYMLTNLTIVYGEFK